MDSNIAIEAAVARKSDAEVSFKIHVFLMETIYNLFGFLTLPLIIHQHGWNGARNRLYIGCSLEVFGSAIIVVAFLLFNVLHIIFHERPDYSVSHFEVIVVDVVYLLRCMTVAAKYSYYSWAELREVDIRKLPMERILEKLVLVGWVSPTPHLLYAELERSLVRTAPALCTHKILYADSTNRDAMIWEMRHCIPSYMEYELGINVKEEAERQKKVDEATKAAKAALQALSEAKIVNIDAETPTNTAKAQDNSMNAEEEEAEKDDSLEAHGFRRITEWLNTGSSKFCEYDLQSAMKDASRTFASMGASLRTVSSTSISELGKGNPPPPPSARSKQVELTCEMLPYIPAKLVCWHAIYSTHIVNAPTLGVQRWLSFFAGYIFAALPLIVRGGLGLAPFGSFWGSYVTEAALIWIAALNFTTTCRYVFVAPLDFSRRLKAMAILASCIDPTSNIATEFRIPVEKRKMDTAALPSANEALQPSRSPKPFNLMPISAMPISRVAAERVSELESCQLEDDNSALHRTHHARFSEHHWQLDGTARVTTGDHVNIAAGTKSSFVLNPLATTRAAAALPIALLTGPVPSGRMSQALPSPDTDVVVAASDVQAISRSGRTNGTANSHSLSYSRSPGQSAIHTIHIGPNARIESFAGRAFAFKVVADSTGRDSTDVLIAAATSATTMQTWMAFIQGMIDSAQFLPPDSAQDLDLKPAGLTIPLADVRAVAVRRPVRRKQVDVEEGDNDSTVMRSSQDDSDRDSEDEDVDALDAGITDSGAAKPPSTIRASILARHRLIAMDAKDGSSKPTDSRLHFPILYGENLVSWMSIRQVVLDFGETFKQRIQLYTAFFAIICVIGIILLFFGFGQSGMTKSDQFVMISVVAFTQLNFSVVLAYSIVMGAKLNDAAVLHRFKLSRIETLICECLVAAETPGLSTAGRLSGQLGDDPVQRQLALTRQVASSLSASLMIETAILPARVLFMPASFALLSTFWSLSMSGVLSAARTFQQ